VKGKGDMKCYLLKNKKPGAHWEWALWCVASFFFVYYVRYTWS
jgi:hypothetical protein